MEVDGPMICQECKWYRMSSSRGGEMVCGIDPKLQSRGSHDPGCSRWSQDQSWHQRKAAEIETLIERNRDENTGV